MLVHPIGRRSLLAGAAGSFAASALVQGAAAQATPKRGGILRVACPYNPSTLDPMTGSSGNDHIFLYTIYDTLIEWEYSTLMPKPGLAKAWSYPDPNTLLLDLQPGVMFHDGTPFDAQAVKFNLDRGRQDPTSNVKPDLGKVTEVVVTGPLQVALKLSQPDTSLPLTLSDRAGMMVSPKAAQALGREHDRAPVGTGAWKFVSWQNNEKVTVTRNEGYWKPGRPYLDGIELSVINEVNTGLRSVIGGQNDFVFFLSPQQKAVVDRAKNLVSVSGPTLYCIQLYLNYGRKPLNDVRVRQALNYAVDREAFNKATMAGLAEPATLNIPSSHWAYDKVAAARYPYDPDKAKALLTEAGYKDGLDLDLQGTSDQRSVQREEVLTEQLAKAGIRAHFTNGMIPATTTKFFVDKQHDAYLSAWTGRPDPSLTYQLLFGKDAFYNTSRTDPVPDLAAALQATSAGQTLEERKIAFAKVEQLVADNALIVPLVFQNALDAYRTSVKGYRLNLLGKPKFEDVWLDGQSG
ncbi:MAG: ABC transporter substrate-binding protein [Acetobacteraceae bacterium]|nr:peptide ABC transporter [Pseudomonadota bacterium]